jgi:signal transduction histidine kinase
MPKGGRLTITTSNVPHGEKNKPIELAAGDYVSVSVRDNGTGMTDEVLRKAFEPFFTTKPVGIGTGIGLSVCQAVVQKLGGRISVRSKVGQGTTFEVRVPTEPAAAVEEPPVQKVSA